MLLLNNIRSIAQVLKLHHIPLETERKLYVRKSYKRSSEVLSLGGMQYNFFGKSQDYNTTMPYQEKFQRAES